MSEKKGSVLIVYSGGKRRKVRTEPVLKLQKKPLDPFWVNCSYVEFCAALGIKP
jgi:hypothetical protein